MLSRVPFEVPHKLLAEAHRVGSIRMAIANVDTPAMAASVKAAVAARIIHPIIVGDRTRITAARTVALVRAGAADAIMKGDIHSATLLRAVLDRRTGLRREDRVSHVFHMTLPGHDRPLYITDAAINVAPDARQLVTIARNAVALAHAVGNHEPKVAFLSASEIVDPGLPSTLLMREAAEAATKEIPGARFAGPLAFDNAVSVRAAKLKHIENAVAGHADILVVPNIETGNALFKMMVWFMSACAAGVVAGAACPIVLTSRADPPEAHLAATICAALLARSQSRNSAALGPH